MDQKPSPKTGLKRIYSAFFYSLSGLRYAFVNEAAFRQELFLVSISLIALFFVPFSFPLKCILFFATVNIMIVEVINSAIEAIVDMVTSEYNALAKHAKDLGSAAVLLSVTVTFILWVAVTCYYLSSTCSVS